MTSTNTDAPGDSSSLGAPPIQGESNAAEPFDDILSRLASRDTSELKSTDVTIKREDRKTAKNFDDIEKDRLSQAHWLRPVFFVLAAALAIVAVGTSSAMICGVVFGQKNISDGLGIAFVSSLSVETLGILALVGRYLFTLPSKATQALDAAEAKPEA